MSSGVADQAVALLRAVAGPQATFRTGQLESIVSLVERRERVLLVQRTGWGKSAVYFIATRLLRERGAGPTLLVSPLLALMRNQIEMAARVGVSAVSINSANRDDWPVIEQTLERDQADLLLVSPERLNNPAFRQEVMPTVARGSGLLVIDEVHCISDWGHDFRPDYRRIALLLDLMPRGVPVLGTTATANDRVVADITDQLGTQLQVQRGTLERESLRLFAAALPDPAARMAWLAAYLPRLPGSGIVYCLTVADTRRVADWLGRCGIEAVAYSGAEEPALREEIEARLLANDVKAVVATSALGMGFDKPDLGFVVHYQAPGSVIAYYQQVGRAGRAVDEAFGVLLAGTEDTDIQDYFIDNAFPPQPQAEAVIALLTDSAAPLGLREIEARVNVKHSRLEAMLKILEVEGAVERSGARWRRTLHPWHYDTERVTRVTEQRRSEQEAMRRYVVEQGCLMAFLRRQLDDRDVRPCGRCGPCTGQALPQTVEPELVHRARAFLRSASQAIEPRKQWPSGLAEVQGRIPEELRCEPGRALSVFGDAGYGALVRTGKFETGRFDDELLAGAVELIGRWAPDPAPVWVTAVPSLRRTGLVAAFAEQLAAALGLEFLPIVVKTRETAPQKQMENSAQQVRNILGAFEVVGEPKPDPVLLVDDIVDSRWTLAVVGALLREHGSGPVLPFALADAGGR
jgi:ATP-dependent DNA helicase RecQ